MTDIAEKIPEILAVMHGHPPEVTKFLTTVRRDGQPYIRQVSTFMEGWDVMTVSRPTNLKMTHIRNNPLVTYLWVKLGESTMPINVWVQGRAEIIDDPVEVRGFLERRSAATGRPIPAVTYDRLVVRTRPLFLRAEGFLGYQTPIFLKEFPAL